MEEICILPAMSRDLISILVLQRLCYRSEAELVHNYSIQPLTQTPEELEEEWKSGVVLKAVAPGGEIVGSVRGREEDGTLYIGKLMVHPDKQGRGLGRALLAAVEEYFPTAVRCELFTSCFSERNLGLYQSAGYREFERRAIGSFEMVYMEKAAASKQ